MTYINYIKMGINIKNLSFSFETEYIVENLNFDVSNGTIGLIKGESGSGKSSLLNVVAGLKRPDCGTIVCNDLILNDKNTFLAPENRNIGYVFQDFALFPHINAMKNITYALDKKFLFTEFITSSLNLNEHLHKMPHELSGGQQQRVAIARAIAPGPNLLFLDEPTSALDPEMTGEVLDLIAELKEGGQDIILTTHEMGFAREVADELIFLDEGKILETGDPKLLLSKGEKNSRLDQFLSRVMRY
jgi:polar amino acid transport system ATP-binding protein